MSPESGRETAPIAKLLRRLDLAAAGRDEFSSPNPGDGRRLFGGLVAAQSVIAAGRTLGEDPAERPLHSLHAYFLRPGRPGVPIRFAVTRLKDGRNFAARTVFAWQEDEIIFTLHASFTRPEDGIAHQDAMPEAPPPESSHPHERDGHPFEMRHCDSELEDRELAEAGTPLPARRRNWMRPRGPVPDDRLVHTALLVYASDRKLISTGARPHGLVHGRRRAASLDHAVWIHGDFSFDDWLLFDMQSPVARNARALVYGAFYRPDGVRIASVAQEGLIRGGPGPSDGR
ncbi:MAG: thioesterase family protein [Deltaproteobacteria bacterium]|nr:thioesterase family protein [Deltaproteobacteria bacterium]MBW2414958.1 thioesterase family protein [Deltaproteobacteria bacterium]